MSGNFKNYVILNKADQPGYVYLGDEVQNDCVDSCLFSSLIGSKNVFITPISSESVLVRAICGRVTKACSIYEYLVESNWNVSADIVIHDQSDSYHRFISLDSRWYIFKDNLSGVNNFTRFAPNCFISSFKTQNGDLVVDWRSITSDGSVLIKPNINSNVFWNGSVFISDEDAFYTPVTDSEDYIYLKTLQNVDIITDNYRDSATIIYKKYADENLYQSSFITKKIRGSHCLEVTDNPHKVDISVKEDCSYPTDQIMDNQKFDNQFVLFESIDLPQIETYRQALLNAYNISGSDLDWVEQFEYNVFNQLFNSLYVLPSQVVDEKNVNIQMNSVSLRQNRFFGIAPNGLRSHHKLPTQFTFKSKQSLTNPIFIEGSTAYPNVITKTTSQITNGAIDDGLDRVLVPPGAVFRTLKAIPGFHSLYENNFGNTAPDEFHFAVDSFGNIVGERSLSSPGLAKFVESTKPAKLSDYDVISKSQVEILLEEMWEKYYGDGQTHFDEDLIDELATAKTDNQMFYTSPHVYINIHNIPIWVEVDIFYDYVIDFNSFKDLYENRFKPVAFYSPTANSEFNKAIDHSRIVKDNTYWNEIIKRYEIGKKVEDFTDDGSYWKYDGTYLENE